LRKPAVETNKGETMNRLFKKSAMRRFVILFAWSALLLLPFNLHADIIIYSEGFENGEGGYTHIGTNDVWECGTPLSSFTLGPSGAHSGNKCWGTNLSGEVPPNSEAYLTSAAISLPALGTNQVMRLRFFAWIAVDVMHDRGEFMVCKEGGEWQTKAELFCTMQGGWNEYTFDISDYAGGNIYLRFKCYTDNDLTFNPPDIPVNMAGFYIDDIAVTVVDAPPIHTKLKFTGWESLDETASCPNIFSWKDSSFVKDNDIFSTAWGPQKEYTDYYQLRNTPRVVNGKYVLYLAETNTEVSSIDLLHLIAVDHSPQVRIATDDSGNICTYLAPKQPQSAIDKNGNDVLPLIKSADGIGYNAYNNDSIVFDFSNLTIGANANLIVRARGFRADTAVGTPTNTYRPMLQIQTKDATGAWATRHVYYPRMLPSINGFDLHNYFGFDKKVKIVSLSCLTGKYHLIDYVGLATGAQASYSKTDLSPVTAIRPDSVNIATLLATTDNMYAQTVKGERTRLAFTIPVQPPNTVRDFVIKSKGYFVPSGTFFFYTWDGAKWVQHDAWTAPDQNDQTQIIDFSQWLPDPTGEYKVRIWQDYLFDPAAINFAGLTRDGVPGVMSYATDLVTNTSVLDAIKDSDNVYMLWDYYVGYPMRNRWVEIGWTGFPINLPPTTNPVTVQGTTISWTYNDPESNPQVNADVEVWTGPDGTGNNIWNPATLQGTGTSIVYAGSTLVPGPTYYARVKAFDGTSWGGWSECAFVYAATVNHPPVAEAGLDQTIAAGAGCTANVTLDGSGSHDPDGDTLTYTWTGPFPDLNGVTQHVTLPVGVYKVYLHVNDRHIDVEDSVMITVKDTTAPVPNVNPLLTITGSCSATIPSAPTATDNCSGKITGTTSDPLTYSVQGTYTVTWKYNDGYGNTSTQTQTVIVNDNVAPVPDVASLPTITGQCSATIANMPTASDNCSGKVTGTTTSPLTYTAQGTYTITWKYADAKGNTSTQTQTVIIKDNIAPVPTMAQLSTITGTCSAIVPGTPTALDNCKGTITGTTTNPLTYTVPGTYSVIWKYDDGNGNTTTQNQTVIVVSGPCCSIPTDSAYNYSIVANNISWAGSGVCNTGSSSIHANGEYSMTGSSIIYANIFACTDITRKGSTMLYGNATSPIINQTGSGTITGIKKTIPVAPTAIPTIDWTPYYNWALAHRTVYNGNLQLTGSRDTIIPGGILWVNGTFKLSGSMSFTGCVIATGAIDISGSGSFTKVNSVPVIASTTGSLSLSGSGKITGLIFAPNGGITKSGSGDVTGSLICKGDLTKTGSWSTLTYTKIVPIPPGCN
jgi:hypothetical protein